MQLSDRPSLFSSLTLYQVDVSPPELQGAQPFLGIIPQPPQIPAGALPQLAPTAELASLLQALRTNRGQSHTLSVENLRYMIHFKRSQQYIL